MRNVGFFGYIKTQIRWIFSVLFCGIIMTVVMILNQIPNQEILYGMLLCMALWICVAMTDYLRYRKHYQKLLEMEAAVAVSLQGLPESGGPIELQYQKLLQKLLEEKREMEYEMLHREREQAEYYTMWIHQIKTPIAALKLLLQERDDCSKEQSQEELQELFRIEQYAEMALSYTRLKSESTDFVFRDITLDDVICEVLHKYAKQFIRKKISLNYERLEKVVLTDEKWLGFVIGQLLSNALKYTPKGSISIYETGNCLVIADTGIGIRQEDLPRVCEMGYTGYNGHADKCSTGIGLYLCSHILKKLGHGFSVTSEEGKGTCVKIEFYEKEAV